MNMHNRHKCKLTFNEICKTIGKQFAEQVKEYLKYVKNVSKKMLNMQSNMQTNMKKHIQNIRKDKYALYNAQHAQHSKEIAKNMPKIGKISCFF